MVKALYNLVWSVDGVEKRHVVEEFPLFIGRLPKELSNIVENYDPLGVYVYYPSGGKAYHTGVVSATVSRFHVKLVEKEGRVYIVDHGPEGRGSKNGTYLNGVRVRPGELVPLSPGDSFQLGTLGPLFTFTVTSAGEELITLEEKVPTLLPKNLAIKLAKVDGVQMRVYDENTAWIIPESIGGKEVRIEGLIVKFRELSERERIFRTLVKLQNVVQDALECIESLGLEKALPKLQALKLDVYRKAVGIDEGLKRAYDELIMIVDSLDTTSREVVKRRLLELRELLRRLIENL